MPFNFQSAKVLIFDKNICFTSGEYDKLRALPSFKPEKPGLMITFTRADYLWQVLDYKKFSEDVNQKNL